MPADPGRRQREAGRLDPHPEDAAAILAGSAARAGDDIEVAQIPAPEAQAGHHRQRDRDVAAVASVRLEHGDPAAVGVGHPHGSVARHLQPVRHAGRSEIGEPAPLSHRAVGRYVVHPHERGPGIAVIEAPPVRREAESNPKTPVEIYKIEINMTN